MSDSCEEKGCRGHGHPLIGTAEAGHQLRDELDRLDREDADRRARRERWLRGGP